MLEAKKRFKTLGRPQSDNFAREYRMFVTVATKHRRPALHRAASWRRLPGDWDGLRMTRSISSDVDAIKVFKARTDLAPEVKRKILSDNARALYGL